jgi:uncharacterized protein YcbK (DUF882 family)
MFAEHFARSEFKCKCGRCLCDTVDVELLSVLGDVRKKFDAPVHIISGHRCPRYNALVGGVSASRHLLGQAADISVAGVGPTIVYDYLKLQYPDRYGIGLYATFVHVDVRGPKARW